MGHLLHLESRFLFIINISILCLSIYKVHDELKDKDFRFEMGLVGRVTGGLHLINPSELTEKARKAGDAANKDEDSDNETH